MRLQRMHWKGSSGSGKEHMREGLVVLHRTLVMTNAGKEVVRYGCTKGPFWKTRVEKKKFSIIQK